MEYIFRTLRAGTAISTPINEALLPAQFARITPTIALWQNNLNVPPEKPMENHDKYKHQGNGIKDEK